MRYAKPYNLTPRRAQALRRAQIAAATRRRYGYTRHDISRFVAKGIRKAAHTGTLGATSKVVKLNELIESAKKRR